MNVRAIVLVLALSSLISTSVGSYLYYNSARQASIRAAEVEFANKSKLLHEHVSRSISTDARAANGLALFEELQEALLKQDLETLSHANRVLDHFASGLSYDACFLMDRNGTTIASSNRNRSDSFVGNNYSFRPYFQTSMQGLPSVYMAVGVTSGVRGLFFSHPVKLSGSSEVMGVAVIKASVENLVKEILRPVGGIALLVHRSGMVFAASRKDWVLKFLWKVSPEQSSSVAETQQFGKGPWEWTGLKITGADRAIDRTGESFTISQTHLRNFPEWRTVYMQSLSSLSGEMVAPLAGWTGYAVLAVLVLVGSTVFFLYFMAQRDILSRRRTEEVLRTEREKLQSLAEGAPFGMVTISSSGRFLYVNPRFKNMFGFDAAEIPTGKDWFREHFR